MRIPLTVLAIVLGLAPGLAAQEEPSPVDLAFFESRVRPILAERCFECHSVKTGKSKGGLTLDTRAGLLKGGESGAAVVPGMPERSRLISAVVQSDADLQMPPKGRLPQPAIDVLASWVKGGAPMPHEAAVASGPSGPSLPWSFRPLHPPAPPPIVHSEWPRTPVDCFVLAKLEERGLRPAPDTDKRTWLRRVTFDLAGLPPTPEETDAFLADDAPDAFEKVVDRLLASPRYGERWGRHWLDVVRYADSSGNSSDFPVPDAWRFRNYVIDSFNRDKPYEAFIREQIAGDLLPHRNDAERREHLVATGFLALARRFGGRRAEADHLTIEDAIDTMGRSILGLSLSCARCHDHKFDPVPTEDYYALYGILESTRFPFPGTEADPRPTDTVLLVPEEEADAVRKPFRESLARLDGTLRRLEKDKQSAEYREARKARDEFARTEPPVDSAYAVCEGRPHDARLQIAGNPNNLGRAVPRRFLSALGGQPLPAESPGSGRLELAAWLTDRKTPLPWRVAANRIWQYHFGRGLVRTPNDFGNRGRTPSHPELLDYLADRFRDEGGSWKALHRLIVLSRVYRMSSRAAATDIDPEDELLWKFPSRRLDAESLRDAMLSVSGELDASPGGAHPFPPSATWTFTQHHPFIGLYESRRRSVYLMQQRNQRHPFFALFDGADPNASTPERTLSTTPLQALYFLNNPFVHENAARFADRLLASAPGDRERIDLSYRLALGRPPTADETRRAAEYLRSYPAPSRGAWSSLARALFASNEFCTID